MDVQLRVALPVLGDGAGGGERGAGGGGEDGGGGCGVAGDGAEGGGEDTETVGDTNCVRPGIWVVSRWSPRPTAAVFPGDAFDAAPIPASGLPTELVGEEGAAVTDDVTLFVPALVMGTVANADAPSAASPVGPTDVRVSLPDLLVGETGCDTEAVACEVTVSLDGAAPGDCAGRFVSLR